MTSNGKPKYQDSDTMNLLNTHDIICLQEIRQDIPVPNFCDYSSVRLNKKTGGVAILIKDNLAEGLSIIETTNPDIIVGKLQKSFFGLDKDLYIVNTYARPENASGNHIKSGQETISDCDEIMANLPEGDILLCGDFNARVSNDPCQTSESEDSFVPLPLDYVPDTIDSRVSQDQKRNNQGHHFKELIQNHQLRILNGRTLGDFTGRFTSIQFAGCSVVDYIASSRSLTPRIDHMKVLDLLPTSDHRPLTTVINCLTAPIPKIDSLKGNYDVAPPRFIVSEAGKESFKTLLSNPATKEALAPIKAMLEEPAKAYLHLSTHLQALCGLTFKKSKPGRSPSQSSKPWHKKKHKVAKTMLDRATKLVNRFPEGQILRENYYRIRGSYRRMKRNDESKYDAKLNSDIMNGKIMNWQAFSNLKNSKTNAVSHNALEMEKFGEFFKDLYANSHSIISESQKRDMQAEADLINNQTENKTLIDDALVNLNSEVTLEETVRSIKQLKSGKAAGSDMISNEVLKLLDEEHQMMLTQVFNCCFKQGIYPWNSSIITPLHKKGSTKNPDNYRAVSVSSSIGKLMSCILLERLKEFRSVKCPDHPNQLGFRKKCQTNDHIFTMLTLTQKAKKQKKPLYAIMVDFRKAFDSIPREALFLKLARMGITGNFYNILRDMYGKSTGRIKLSGHVSREFPIRKGTEQGHPLSPELFKIFLFDLSPLLDNGTGSSENPSLRNIKVTHLLFADDLIMLSLSRKAAQKQVKILYDYCKTWGLEMNLGKTKLIAFNEGDTTQKQTIYLSSTEKLDEATNYCYLGIKMTSSGDFSIASRADLHLKATRAVYGLKRTIRRDKISFSAGRALFNSLIKPILLYGAPIWAPMDTTVSRIIKDSAHGEANSSLLRKISADKSERLLLSYLKWLTGVHRKTQNAAIWGDSNTIPLNVEALDISVKYLSRIKTLDPTWLVNAAYHEQKNLGLPWYRSLVRLLEIDPLYRMNHFEALEIKEGRKTAPELPKIEPIRAQTHAPSRIFRVPVIHQRIASTFSKAWSSTITTSRKMEFYRHFDREDGVQSYLRNVTNFTHRTALAKLRMSSHSLNIEVGRHQGIARGMRNCPYCNTTMGINITETELHVIDTCDLYNPERQTLATDLLRGQDPPQPIPTTISSLMFTTSKHSPRISGLIARFASAIECKRERWMSSMTRPT